MSPQGNGININVSANTNQATASVDQLAIALQNLVTIGKQLSGVLSNTLGVATRQFNQSAQDIADATASIKPQGKISQRAQFKIANAQQMQSNSVNALTGIKPIVDNLTNSLRSVNNTIQAAQRKDIALIKQETAKIENEAKLNDIIAREIVLRRTGTFEQRKDEAVRNHQRRLEYENLKFQHKMDLKAYGSTSLLDVLMNGTIATGLTRLFGGIDIAYRGIIDSTKEAFKEVKSLGLGKELEVTRDVYKGDVGTNSNDQMIHTPLYKPIARKAFKEDYKKHPLGQLFQTDPALARKFVDMRKDMLSGKMPLADGRLVSDKFYDVHEKRGIRHVNDKPKLDYVVGQEYNAMGGTEESFNMMQDLLGVTQEKEQKGEAPGPSKEFLKGMKGEKAGFKTLFSGLSQTIKGVFTTALKAAPLALLAIGVGTFKKMAKIGKKIVGYFVNIAKQTETVKALVELIALPFKILFTLMAVPLLTSFLPVFKEMMNWITSNYEVIKQIGELFASIFTTVFTEDNLGIVGKLMNGFATVLAFLAETLNENMKTINTDSIASFIASTIMAITGVIQDVLLGLVAFCYSAEGQAFIISIAEALGKLFGTIMDILIALIPILAESIVTFIYGVFEGVASTIGKAVASLIDAVDGMFGHVLKNGVNAILSFINTIIGALRNVNLFGWQPFAGVNEIPMIGDSGFRGATTTITNDFGVSSIFNVVNNNNIGGGDALKSILQTGGY